jgi:hypothetical protein
MKALPYSLLTIVFMLLIGCDRGLGKALRVSVIGEKNLLSKDELVFKNDSDLIAVNVTGKVKLKYQQGVEELNVAWAKWEPGEKKRVSIPKSLGELQSCQLVGKIEIAGKDGKPNYAYQALDSSWIWN